MSPRALRRYGLIAFAVLLALLPQLPVPEFWITQANYIGSTRWSRSVWCC
jgi:hypothetical protein